MYWWTYKSKIGGQSILKDEGIGQYSNGIGRTEMVITSYLKSVDLP